MADKFINIPIVLHKITPFVDEKKWGWNVWTLILKNQPIQIHLKDTKPTIGKLYFNFGDYCNKQKLLHL